ncbi:non-ribosomal peptide synthetase [Kutzneria buriramensis]|uniref:Amino acid adenylation domain-containing protein n=1 Tax=Kutzneria buriramensis TaxID=1045776 RepID=A0A3E0H6T4_9PSEU|nr:non-ribosomal peptide synthetase [Kutzneria buriramensis]REH39192.1 amino acid adenylation domain-containing protein [Kutzneria buriramensis]
MSESTPASYAQEGLWLLEQVGAGAAVNNLPMAWRVQGEFDVEAFEAALNLVATRNPVLLTEPRWDDETNSLVSRQVHTELPVHFRRTGEQRAYAELRDEALRPFPAGTPLVRAHVWDLGMESLVLLVLSHLVFDGGSEASFFAELDHAYRHVTIGTELPDAPEPFDRFAKYQRDRFQGQDDRIAGIAVRRPVPQPVALPSTVDGKVPADATEGVRHYAHLDGEAMDRIRRLGRQHGASEVMVLLTAFFATTARLSGQESCSVLMPYANRAQSWAGNVIGPCLNSLYITVETTLDKSFAELIDTVRGASLDAYETHDVPAEALRAKWAEAGAEPRTNLMLNVFADARPELTLAGCTTVRLSWEQVPVRSRADLCLYGWPEDDGLRLEFLYRTAALTEADVASLAASMTGLLAAALDDPDRSVRSLPMDRSFDTAEMLAGELIASPQLSVVDQVWAAASNWPEEIAIDAPEGEWTYRDLVTLADRCAAGLLERGLDPGDVVAVPGTYDRDVVVAALGVLRAGGVLLLLQSDLPDARLAAIRAAARPALEITDPPFGESEVDVPIGQDDPAYIFFTSGSTGVPKGVLGRHGGLGHFLAWERGLLDAEPGDRLGWRTNLGFDVVLRDLFLPLVSGATLVVPRPADLDDPVSTLAWLDREAITLLHITPSLSELLSDPATATRLPALRAAMFAGEPLTDKAVDRWRANVSPRARVVNLYGPTETTLAKCWFDVPATPSPGVQPIGRTQPETQVAILGPDGTPAGVGEPGEIVIRTPHRSLGYLSGNAFRRNPFGDDLLYHSGDLGRRRPDGLLEILGRADDEVKVHGVRVQPAEVTAALRGHPDVEQAVVVKAPDGHGLVAYVVPKPGVTLSPPAVLRHVAATLPPAFVPGQLVELERLPLLSNGKVDKRSLPAPPVRTRAVTTEPRTPAEHTVVAVFREVLGLDEVGADDGFVELGGHSLLAMRASALLRRRFGVRVPATAVLQRSTPTALAAWLTEQAPAVAATAVQKDEPYQAGLGQERMFFLEELTAAEPGVYNIPWCFRLTGALDRSRLESAVVKVVERHAPLRTGFQPTVDGLLAEPHPASEVFDFRTAALDGPEALPDFVQRELTRPLDLRAGQCLRATLVELGADDFALVLIVHHVAADGWSLSVLQNELSALYQGTELPPAANYADFATRQRELPSNLAGVAEHLQGAPERYGLPTDRPRGSRQTFRGDRVTLDLPAGLREAARRRAVTPFALIAAAYAAALAARGADTEIVLGAAVANRPEPEHQDLIGCFINSVPLRIALPASGLVEDLITVTAAEAQRALTDADVPFERLLGELGVPRTVSFPPVFQAMLVMQQAEPATLRLPGVEVTEIADVRPTAKTDLSLIALLDGHLTLEYNTDLFDRATAESLLRHIEYLLLNLDGRFDTAPPWEQAQELAAAAGPMVPTSDDTLLTWIRRTAAEHPDAPAVAFGDTTLTYRRLLELADVHGRRLREAGVQTGELVAVQMERSAELVVALLGVLAAGAAYLPLDTAAPVERLAMITATAGVQVTLTADDIDLAAEPVAPLDISVPKGEAAYCIFTSGSTGAPKGVVVGHEAIVNRLRWMQDAYRLDGSDVVLQKTPYTFDVSVWEFFLPLLAGAKLVMAKPGGHRDPGYLIDEIRREGVTVLHFVPPMLAALLEQPGAAAVADTVRLVVCSGEALEAGTRDRFYEVMGVGPRLENLYGPTEAAVDVSRYSCRPGDGPVVPIGWPIDNIQLHVLDRAMRQVPTGGVGELHIGGIGLAHGYVGRPDLTADRFVPDPFGRGRLYRTGDLVRRRADGALEYLGRTDFQVKIRGVRIELGEIEARLVAQPEVADAVVVVNEGAGGGKELIGYVTSRSDVDGDALIDRLRLVLPDYMCPALVVVLEEFPLGTTGKVDRRALPDPAGLRPRTSTYREPGTESERAVAQVWSDVLKATDPVGLDDNFFALGGDSLSAVRVVGVAAERGWKLALDAVFAARTLGELAASALRQEAADARPRNDFAMLSAADLALLDRL